MNDETLDQTEQTEPETQPTPPEQTPSPLSPSSPLEVSALTAALAAKADASALEGKADVTALEELQSGMPRIVWGSYTGDGAELKRLELGISPRVVIIGPASATAGGYHVLYYGCTGSRLSVGNNARLTWRDTGITMSTLSGAESVANTSGVPYCYVAIGFSA